MQKKTKFIIFIVAIIIIVVGFGVYSGAKSDKSGKYDSFAKCLTLSGAKFYGAFWCSHCNNQKKAFGSSQQYLPFVECSSDDGKEQLQICKDEGIEGYPTWVFADGTRLSGEVSFETLAEKTQCVLPQ